MLGRYAVLNIFVIFAVSGCVTNDAVDVRQLVDRSNPTTFIQVLQTDELQIKRLSVDPRIPAKVNQKKTAKLNKLNIMAKKLIKAGPRPNMKIPVRLKDCGGLLNEAASSDGTITICNETLRQLKYEDEVAFLIGHELSHHILIHSPEEENYIKEQAKKDIETTDNVMSGVALGLQGAFHSASNMTNDKDRKKFLNNALYAATASALYFNKLHPYLGKSHGAKLNRKEEDEADILGIDLLSKAGWNPQFSIRVLSILDEIEIINNEEKGTSEQRDRKECVGKASFSDPGVDVIDSIVDNTLCSVATVFASTRNHSKATERMEFASTYIKTFYKKESVRRKRRF